MMFSVTVGAVGFGRDPRGLAELARVVEDAGWDGLFLEDYLVYQGDTSQPTYEPWVCLAAIAAGTDRIRIGTTVTPLPRRMPWEVAAQAVGIDQLSGGRMVLGVGSGDLGDPFMPRVTPRVLAEMLDEGLVVIDRLWSGQPVSFSGKHYQLESVQLTARPVQPRIPIWVGGNLLVPGVRRRIATWGGSCAYKGSTTAPQQITPDDVLGLIRDGATEVKVSGGDPAAFAAAGAAWWGKWIAPMSAAETIAIVRQGPPKL